MYVYRQIRDGTYWLYVVGFYSPDGEWHPESDHETKEAAAQRVHWLNGGKDELVKAIGQTIDMKGQKQCQP